MNTDSSLLLDPTLSVNKNFDIQTGGGWFHLYSYLKYLDSFFISHSKLVSLVTTTLREIQLNSLGNKRKYESQLMPAYFLDFSKSSLVCNEGPTDFRNSVETQITRVDFRLLLFMRTNLTLHFWTLWMSFTGVVFVTSSVSERRTTRPAKTLWLVLSIPRS